MSYVFDIDDETVWSPALRIGDLYVRMLTDIGGVLGIPTGLTAVASDMYDIDIDAFERLVRSMYETYFSTGNQILRGLVAGVLAPSTVILERGGRPIVSESAEEQCYLEDARSLSMAR